MADVNRKARASARVVEDRYLRPDFATVVMASAHARADRAYLRTAVAHHAIGCETQGQKRKEVVPRSGAAQVAKAV
jgi:hypothetical protein